MARKPCVRCPQGPTRTKRTTQNSHEVNPIHGRKRVTKNAKQRTLTDREPITRTRQNVRSLWRAQKHMQCVVSWSLGHFEREGGSGDKYENAARHMTEKGRKPCSDCELPAEFSCGAQSTQRIAPSYPSCCCRSSRACQRWGRL